eukprot:521948-Amphidinium_carterae.1
MMLPAPVESWIAEMLSRGFEDDLARAHFPLAEFAQPTAREPRVHSLGPEGTLWGEELKMSGDIFVDGSAFRPKDRLTSRA